MECDDPLDAVYEVKPGLDYEIDDGKIVTVLHKQDHWIQRCARKLAIRIPAYRRISMDDFASFVFLSIDGTRTTREIGEILARQYGDRINPLHQRLLMFLHHIERNEHFIVRKDNRKA
jgi:hypothetical protein